MPADAPRVLVTGASGFAGPFLIRHLQGDAAKVVGTTHGPDKPLPENCRPLPLDVTDAEAVRRAVSEVRPDEIYHLAGLTRPASGAVDAFYAVNFNGALNVLEAVREEAPEAAVLLIGSAYAYGRVDRPIAETDPFDPMNHYGVSKAAADLLGRSYAAQGMRVVNARPFNHSGPGQSPDFLLPTLVEQFAEIKTGRREPVVKLGNLDSIRDLSDVRDVVKAYVLALRRGRPGEAYNVGSGTGYSVREIFDLVREAADTDVELQTEPSRVRATDIPYLVADTGKAGRDLGWAPETPLEKTVGDMLSARQETAGKS